MALPAHNVGLDQFEEGKSAGGHASEMEDLPYPAVSPSMTPRRFPPPWRDALTGVGNRRAFFERGEKLLYRSAFDCRPTVLLLFDLDGFKQVNDTFGHHVGDRVLTAFCGTATAALRPDDLFGRLGGEEFASLLPHTSLDEGLAVAERIRSNFEATTLEVGANTLAATVSVGVAISIDSSRKLANIIKAADRALYRAKANGRNRVEHASGAPEER
jgi:diguanylate cyclase (GGDEF)-like protein